jgi:phosphatidylserine decarboxylase
LNPWWVAPPLTLGAVYLYWRYVWFFRNPARVSPPGENIVSPADGTVVYIRVIKANHEVLTIKQGVSARLTDIVKEDLDYPKLSVGIFMSPFNVHYNRVPLAGQVDAIKHHPPEPANLAMTSMHWRTVPVLKGQGSKFKRVGCALRTKMAGRDARPTDFS